MMDEVTTERKQPRNSMLKKKINTHTSIHSVQSVYMSILMGAYFINKIKNASKEKGTDKLLQSSIAT